MEKFDKEKFALWMQDGFRHSEFKTQKELVEAVRSNPATISRLMTGSAQSTNNKASQPPRELVVNLARAFKKDENEALLLAGHAPAAASALAAPNQLRGLLRTAEKMSPEDRDRFLRQALALAKTYFPPDFDFDYVDEE